MGVNLSKGGNISLTKEAPGVTKYVVGLGWDPRTTDGTAFDLDASAIAVKADGQVLSDQHFVFFNNLESPEKAIVHTGDNLTGEGGGDDEQIKVDTSLLPAEIDKIVFPVTIHEADTRSQNFGQVSKSYIHVSGEDGTEIARYDLGEDASTETAMTFGELYRNGPDEWKFRAVGAGSSAGLAGIAGTYGVKA